MSFLAPLLRRAYGRLALAMGVAYFSRVKDIDTECQPLPHRLGCGRQEKNEGGRVVSRARFEQVQRSQFAPHPGEDAQTTHLALAHIWPHRRRVNSIRLAAPSPMFSAVLNIGEGVAR